MAYGIHLGYLSKGLPKCGTLPIYRSPSPTCVTHRGPSLTCFTYLPHPTAGDCHFLPHLCAGASGGHLLVISFHDKKRLGRIEQKDNSKGESEALQLASAGSTAHRSPEFITALRLSPQPSLRKLMAAGARQLLSCCQAACGQEDT